MNSSQSLILLSSITLAGALAPSTSLAQSTEKKILESQATVTHNKALVPSGGWTFSDQDLSSHLSSLCTEKGNRPLGYHIEAKNGVLHDEHDGDLHVVFFHVVDKDGRKRSDSVGTFLYHEFLTFQWFDHQKRLLVITNAHKHFDVNVYEQDAKGDFKILEAAIDPDETREKITVVTCLKGHPEWTRTLLGPFKEGESPEHVLGGDSAVVDDVSTDDTTVDISVDEHTTTIDFATVRICYRFDASTQKFARLKSILLGDRMRPVLTLSNAKLEKAIKEIVLP